MILIAAWHAVDAAIFDCQPIHGDGLIFALDAIEDFEQQALGIGRCDSGGRGLNGDAARAHERDFEAVGRELVGDLREDHFLARRELCDDGNQHALTGELSLTARAEMLLEKNALVGDVLVDNPETFAVYGHDEAGIHLAERLEGGEAFSGSGALGGIRRGRRVAKTLLDLRRRSIERN